MLNLYEGSQYLSGFNMLDSEYSRIVNMPGFRIFFVTQFAYFGKYDTVLNMRWDSILEGF